MMPDALVTQAQIDDIALAVDAQNNRTPDALAIGMMVVAMGKLQGLYEAELATLHARIATLERELAEARAEVARKTQGGHDGQ